MVIQVVRVCAIVWVDLQEQKIFPAVEEDIKYRPKWEQLRVK